MDTFRTYVYVVSVLYITECKIHPGDKKTNVHVGYRMMNNFKFETLKTSGKTSKSNFLMRVNNWSGDRFRRGSNTMYQKKKETFCRKRRNTDNQKEMYPTEDDRNMVKHALNNLNLKDGNLYKILLVDHLYCPVSFTCMLKPRMNTSDLHPDFDSCCDQCSCEEDCHFSESCCADAKTAQLPSYVKCITSQYLPYGKTQVNHIDQIKVIAKCKSELKTKEKEACEGLEDIKDSLDGSRPVFSNGTIYRNRFCALCNSVSESDILLFPAEMRCPSSEGLYASNLQDLLQKLALEKRCNIFYTWPKNILDTTEEKHKCKTGLIRNCNVTGNWRHYDPGIEKRCASYTHVYRKIYRNVFCYMCNNNIDPNMKCDFIESKNGKEPQKLGSFTAMLHFLESDGTKTIKYDGHMCKSDEITDAFKQTCVSVQCSKPFAFNKMTKACSKVYEDVQQTYELFLHVTLDAGFNTDVLVFVIRDFLNRESSVWKYYWLRVFGVSHLYSSSLMHTVYHMIYVDYDSLNRINHVLNISNHIKAVFGVVTDVKILTGQVYKDLQIQSTYRFPYDGRLLDRLLSIHDKSLINLIKGTDIQRISRLLVCPYITLQNYTTFLNKSTYELCVVELDICFQQPDFQKKSDSYHVCIDVFEKKIKEFTGTTQSRLLTSGDEVEGNLSLVCTCISVASLLYVVLTFILFKSLRTFPGKLMMILAFGLLIAHVLYPFGLFQTKHPLICRVLGILIHFSWLWVIFWMNISCFHMVSVFSRILPTDVNTKSRFVSYIVYTFLCSLSFVGINVVVSYLQGKGIGYGGDSICWISRPEMVRYVFALPLGWVIFSNLLMILRVVIIFYRRPNLQGIKHRNRQDFVIFVKLTSITGISWLFGFLYEWLGIKAFSYLFIVFTGCQGLYLMVAFSCNSNVRHLYKVILKESLPSSRSESDSPSTFHETDTPSRF